MRFDLAVRHHHLIVVCTVGITDTGQHVRNRICHRHGAEAFLATVPRSCRAGACRERVGSVRRPSAGVDVLRPVPLPVGRATNSWPPMARKEQQTRRRRPQCENLSLPRALGDPGKLAAVRHLPQAHPAQAERPVDRPRPAAALATGVAPHTELRLADRLFNQCLLRHLPAMPSLWPPVVRSRSTVTPPVAVSSPGKGSPTRATAHGPRHRSWRS